MPVIYITIRIFYVMNFACIVATFELAGFTGLLFKLVMKELEGKYKNGAHVVARSNPGRPLVIRRFVDHIYYCIDAAKPNEKDQVYFERELAAV